MFRNSIKFILRKKKLTKLAPKYMKLTIFSAFVYFFNAVSASFTIILWIIIK